MTWAIIRRSVKLFLDTTWIVGSQYIIFRDSSIAELVRARCLEADADKIRTLHAYMAEFYRCHSSIKEIATARVLYHYEQAHWYQELVTYLSSLEGRLVARHDRENYLRVSFSSSIELHISGFTFVEAPSLYQFPRFGRHRR
jgi:hypothetical protein